MKQKIKLAVLEILSFIVSIAPLAVVLIMNWGKYTKGPSETVRLWIGSFIIIAFVIAKVLGKLKVPPRIVTFAVIFLMSYLMQAVLDDLFLLSGMALLGEALDLIIFRRAIKHIREQVLIDRTAEASADRTAEKMREVLNEYIGRA